MCLVQEHGGPDEHGSVAQVPLHSRPARHSQPNHRSRGLALAGTTSGQATAPDSVHLELVATPGVQLAEGEEVPHVAEQPGDPHRLPVGCRKPQD